MAARWYVVRVDSKGLTVDRAEKKPVYEQRKKGDWPVACFVDGTDGEDAVFAGGFMSGVMGLNVGFEDA